MTAVDAAASRRVSILGDGLRLDLAIGADTTLEQALAQEQLDLVDGRHALLTRSGKRIPPHTTAAELSDGAVLAIVDLAARHDAAGRRRSQATQQRADHGEPWWLVLIVAAGLLVSAIASTSMGHPPLGSATAWPIAVALGGATLVIAALWAGAGARPGLPGALALASLTSAGALAGALCAPVTDGGGPLAVALALGAGALACAAAALTASDRTLEAMATTTSVVLLACAAVWAVTVALHLPAALAAGLCLGAAAPGMRAIPEFLLHLPEGYAISYRHFMQNRWTVRGAIPADPGPVDLDAVRPVLAASTTRRATATVVLAAVAVCSAPLLLLGVGRSLVTDVATVGVLGCTVAALTLAPRRATDPVLRWVPRIAAAALAVGGAARFAVDADATLALAAGGALLALGTLAAWLIVPAARGFASLVISRIGDIAESMAVALALPMGLLAGGVIESLRRLVAG